MHAFLLVLTHDLLEDRRIDDCASCVTFLFLPHFDVLCDLLLNRRTETWNLFVLYNKEFKKVLTMTSSMRLSSNRS